MENNDEIINNIREIYRNADANKIHQLIANHFIPSQSEQKDIAEIPTAIPLVDEMLIIIPSNFWESPKKVFEPCCGKGNFIMKIFERFNNGLKKKYPDDMKRCQLIINECIYYADLTKMNVFITTEILKCEVEKVTKKNNVELKFNSHTGNTLELDIKKTFNIKLFDAVIANPLYDWSIPRYTGSPTSTPWWNTFIRTVTSQKMYDELVHGLSTGSTAPSCLAQF